ncbi:hypothetical protein DTO021C3_2623 [Paecilomyces variotii]|nr:hypothetical protein DTO021C3_2623 [Paecilomyces variotii]
MIHIEVAITPSPLLEGSVKDDRQVYTAPLNIVLDRIVCDISWGKKIRKSQENNGSSTRARSQMIHVPSIAPCR